MILRSPNNSLTATDHIFVSMSKLKTCKRGLKNLCTQTAELDNPVSDKSGDLLVLDSWDHMGKCICRFAGIYAYCRYFIDRKW